MRYRFIVVFALLVVGFLIFGLCFPQSKAITLEDDCINIIKLSFFAFEEGDWSSMAELYSPDYLQHSPDFKDPITWPEYDLSCRIVHDRIPDLKYRIVDIFADKNKVAVRSVWEYRSDSYPIKLFFPDGVAKGSAISIFRIEKGKIIEEWCEFNPAPIKLFCKFYKSMEHKK